MMINVAVIGYGHLGKWHCQKVEANSSACLLAIVESNDSNAELAKTNHPNARVVSDIKEIIDDVSAVVIVTPTSTHYDLVKFSLEEKKHVFCEKPLCSSYQEVKTLSKFLNNDKILQVGHSERCHQAWELIENDIAAITGSVIVNISRYAPFKGRATDVDVVQDLMIHDIDLLLYLFKKRPSRLKAYGKKIRTNNWDHVQCTFEYEDGSVATIISGRNHTHEVRSLDIMSTIGCHHVDLFTNTISFAPSGEISKGVFVEDKSYEKRDHLLIEHEAFYAAIKGERDSMVDYKSGLQAVQVVSAVLESLETCDWLTLDWKRDD